MLGLVVLGFARASGAQLSSVSSSDSTCPVAGGAWVDTFFAGDAWAQEQREAVLAELRVELGRRLVEVCYRTRLPDTAAENQLTLIALGEHRVRIVPTRLNGHAAWQEGRTLELAALPLDARPLAIALAADEVLRGRAPPPQPRPVRRPSTRPARSTEVHGSLGVTTRAASLTGRGEHERPLAIGLLARVAVFRSDWGAALGAVVSGANEWSFGHNRFEHLRLPLDLALVRQLDLGALDVDIEGGIVVALIKLSYVGNGRSHQLFDIGGRVATRVAWDRAVAPFVAASLELMPQAHELRLAPDGAIGHTAQLWGGLSIGLQVRLR